MAKPETIIAKLNKNPILCALHPRVAQALTLEGGIRYLAGTNTLYEVLKKQCKL